MAPPRPSSLLLMLSLAVLVLAAAAVPVPVPPRLEFGYYSRTCPEVEGIVRAEMARIIAAAPSLAGPILRLHFHDCFVRGCDGSVLLASTAGNVAERDAKPNRSLRGFGSVERVKAKLEAACPGVVSCADVLTLMARDAVVLARGPYWPVALGRRDGAVSNATEAGVELPPSYGDVPLLARIFASKGLDVKDLAVLSGAHTLGTAHCASFSDRLYHNGSAAAADRSLDREYAGRLRLACSGGVGGGERVALSEMDPGSFRTFDSSYYRQVARRRGLLRSDAALLADAATSGYVRRVATGRFDDAFFRDFGESMAKMGNVGVLAGAQGNVRRKCYVLN